MDAAARQKIEQRLETARSENPDACFGWVGGYASDVERLLDALDAALADKARVEAREAGLREALEGILAMPPHGEEDDRPYQKARAALSSDGTDLLERLKKAEQERDDLRARLITGRARGGPSMTPPTTFGELPVGTRLTLRQAEWWEDEMRRLEADPTVTKHALRLFMQGPMECGHAVGNLLTCPTPPFGCVICGPPVELIEEEKR